VRTFAEKNVFYNSPSAKSYGVFYEYLVVSADDVSHIPTDKKLKGKPDNQISAWQASLSGAQ